MSINAKNNTNPPMPKPFTAKGYRLNSKESGIVLDKYEKQALKDVLPKDAYCYDIVTIETGFGTGHTCIISIRNKDNQLLKRVIEEHKNGEKPSKTISTYNKKMKTLTEDKFTINRVKTENSKTTETQDSFYIPTLESPIIGHTRLQRTKDENGNTQEKQIIEYLKTNDEKEYIETEAIKTKNGEFVDKKIRSNIGTPEELMNDPYLFYRTYDTTDFIKSIAKKAQKDNNLDGYNIKLIIKDLGRETQGSSSSKLTNKVKINPNFNKDKLVDTINHEYRHQWQEKLIEEFSLFGILIKKLLKIKISATDYEMAQKLKNADDNYCPPEKNYKEYHENLLERDARSFGRKAGEEFTRLTKKLHGLFSCQVYGSTMFGYDDSK